MKDTWNFDRCVTVLTGEIELLKKISATQDEIRQAVFRREWCDFDEKTAEVKRLGEKFAILEQDRVKFFASLANESGAYGNMEEKPFHALIMHLPVGERQELSRLYRELKTETIKIQVLGDTFLVYVNEAKNLAAAYLEAVCPARGGKLYTRKGGRVSQDLRSIVVNNSF
ncbi:MAG: hypothetical protein FWH19_03450 [Treponema sp.]|nr:hypothetical protein [Treponema sp.]